ncbi:MAG TPA: Dabb family protein [Puia sp.]|nr:Dabb family protein [Puia sp.]
MKKIILFLSVGLFITGMTYAQTAKKPTGRLLRHVVLFKFKDNATPADIQKVEEAFKDLPDIIKGVKAFEWGKNNSPEQLNQGFTHCFFVSFSSEKDRDNYLPHPAHKAFIALLNPYLDKALVFDYWAL